MCIQALQYAKLALVREEFCVATPVGWTTWAWLAAVAYFQVQAGVLNQPPAQTMDAILKGPKRDNEHLRLLQERQTAV